MVKTCILCKKDWAPFYHFNEARSFHKFPNNDDLRKKWINAIGLSAIPKTAVLCSDHFDNSAFHDTDGNTTRRRLLSDAVPRDINLPDADHTPELLIESEFSCSFTDMEPDIKPDIKPDLSIGNETTMSKDNISNSLERAPSITDVYPAKKIRFMDGFRTEYIYRGDFVSDEAWQRFMRYTIYNKLKLRASHSRNARKKKRMENLKDQVNNLKVKQDSHGAEYPQGVQSAQKPEKLGNVKKIRQTRKSRGKSEN